MKNQIFGFLKGYSTQPLAIDRLLISAYLRINSLTVENNKLLKTYSIQNDDDEFAKLIEFVEIIKKDLKELTFENLTQLFEFVISPADRIVTGAIYTPLKIREFIIDSIFETTEFTDQLKVADISCGCGGFLLSAAKKIKQLSGQSYYEIFQSHIFGLDIEHYSIKRSELLLSLLALESGEDIAKFKFQVYLGDALDFSWRDKIREFSGFSAVIGNPPYVCSRNIKDETKQHLEKWQVCKSGHPDLYIPFFQVGIELLAVNGKLGYITMNSFFKSLNGRALRAYFHELSYKFDIIDFGNFQVFEKRSTYTCICFITKTNSDEIRYRQLDSPDNLNAATIEMDSIAYDSLRAYEGWNLQNNAIISKIERVGLPFSDVYKTRNGIATLKNDVYIFCPSREDDRFYYFDNMPIEKGICQDIINPNLLTNQSSLAPIMEKIIFPYSFESGKAVVFSEAYLKKTFPKAFKYLESKKIILSNRDNGDGKYPEWFAFGRTQSLERMKYKLFFPHITPRLPHYIIDTDEQLTFYNGIAVIGHSITELRVLKKIMSSSLFWFYIKHSSKPYSAKYYSLSKNYIKNFGIYPFSTTEIDYLLKEKEQSKIDSFLEHLYDVEI
jgi:adenine-specific DNA-methyltransferase